jgi:hypothetical protein
MDDVVYEVNLFYEWEYTAWGHRKRNYEYPTVISARQQKFFKGTLAQIKATMIAHAKGQGRQKVSVAWEGEDTIERDAVKIMNVRQATLWSELEDF